MSNTPWNNQGTQAVPMNGVSQALGWGTSMSQYYHQDTTYKVNYDWPSASAQGARGLSGVTNKAYVYVYGQGGTFGSPNGYTNIYYNQTGGVNAQSLQTINLQQNYGARCWIRSFRQSTGYGGAGGRNFQGNANNPPAYAGSPAINVQGSVLDLKLNSQGYYIIGGGGGGGAGAQGSRRNTPTILNQFSPAGGGGGGGGGGYGLSGGFPDARYQGVGGGPGTTYGGGAGGNGAAPGRAGGAGGASGGYGTTGQGGGAGAAPGQTITYYFSPGGSAQITY